jgi:DNA topoisomerase-1
MSVQTLTLEQALELLSFPKTLGVHPESGTDVIALDGPNGPYLRMGDETRSLRDHEHLRAVALDEALTILAQPKQRGRRSGPAALAALGEHPDNGEPVRLLRGRFGPYVTDGTVNASIPKGRDPAEVTLDEAVDLIAAREQKLRDAGKDPRAPKPKRKKRATAKRKTKSRAKK